MFYVISDLHGYPHARFLRLLSEAGFGRDDFLYILGDVIDRNGDGGVATLEWLLYQPNAQLILGNHEAALLACLFVFDEIKEDIEEVLTKEKMEILMGYLSDGGQVTLNAMRKLPVETREDILDYLRDCPYYELIGVGDKNFLLVHSGIDNFSLGKKLTEYSSEDFLWARPSLTDRYYDDIMTVFGHTPTIAYGKEYEGKIIKTDTWINIDQGAGSGFEPVLLRLDDMKEFRLG
ncbi:MAG: metallophosphoesterase [Clostridiales bacterium]|nr:metallophosphoesterase [Clostridiales bacterium]